MNRTSTWQPVKIFTAAEIQKFRVENQHEGSDAVASIMAVGYHPFINPNIKTGSLNFDSAVTGSFTDVDGGVSIVVINSFKAEINECRPIAIIAFDAQRTQASEREVVFPPFVASAKFIGLRAGLLVWAALINREKLREFDMESHNKLWLQSELLKKSLKEIASHE